MDAIFLIGLSLVLHDLCMTGYVFLTEALNATLVDVLFEAISECPKLLK